MRLFKQKKTHYQYNPDTLNFEKVSRTVKDTVYLFFRHLTTGVALGIAIFFGMSYFIDSPTAKQLKKENRLQQTQYEVLSLQLEEAQRVLDNIQQRDEDLYRAIFQAESIPMSIRKAGFGGSDRYQRLKESTNSELVVSTTKKIDLLRKQLYIESNSLDELVTLGKSQKERNECIPAIQPVANKDLKRISAGFGMRIDPIYRVPRFHSGMDFSAKTGTDIYATGEGSVVFASWKQGYGKCIIIDHGFGYKTLYGHMSRFKKRVGQKVTRGEVIGEVGSTGKSTGSHLHYEVRFHDRPQNPIHYYYKDLTPEQYDQMIQIAENRGQVMD